MFLSTRSSSTKLLAIVAICSVMSGCRYTTHHGDAKLIHQTIVYQSVRMVLPPVQLGDVGTTTFQIRNLPIPMYPTDIQIPKYRHSSRNYAQRVFITDEANWGNCSVGLQITTIAGEVIYSRTEDLKDLITGTSSAPSYDRLGIDRYTSLRFFPTKNAGLIEPLTSYDLSITVNNASSHKDDWLRLSCWVSYDSRVQDYRQDWLTPLDWHGAVSEAHPAPGRTSP